MPHNYYVEAKGKRYWRTREYLQPIIYWPTPTCTTLPMQQPTISHIPKLNLLSKHLPHTHLLGPSSNSPCHIPHLPCKQPSPAANALSSIKDFLWHLSTLNPLPSVSVTPEKLGTPLATHPVLTSPVTPEELEAESPPQWYDSSTESDSSPSYLDSTTSTALYTLQPRLPITYNKAALTCLNGWPKVRTLNFLSILLPVSSKDDSTASIKDASHHTVEVEVDSPC